MHTFHKPTLNGIDESKEELRVARVFHQWVSRTDHKKVAYFRDTGDIEANSS